MSEQREFLVCVYIFLIKGNKVKGDDSTKNSKRRERQREREDGNLSWAQSHQTRWQKLVS